MFNKKAKIIFSNLKLVLKYAHSTSTIPSFTSITSTLFSVYGF